MSQFTDTQPQTETGGRPTTGMSSHDMARSFSDVTRLWKGGESNFRDIFQRFLDEYGRDTSDPNPNSAYYHAQALKAMKESLFTFEVDLQHLREFDLAQDAITGISQFMMKHALYLIQEDHLHEVATTHVRTTISRLPEEERGEWEAFFQDHVGSFNIQLVDWKSDPMTLRHLYCDQAAELVTLTGTVTRTSDVRPELRAAYFKCDACTTIVGPIVQAFKFTEPCHCERECKNKRRWTRIDENATHDDWQKVRIQENANEIPAGCLPRSMDIIMRGHLTNQCKAGDKLQVSGTLAVVPDVVSIMAKGEIPKLVLRDVAAASRNELDASNQLRGMKGLGVRDLGCKTTFLVTGLKVTNEIEKQDKEEWNDDHEGGDAMQLRGVDSDTFKALGPQVKRMFKDVASSKNCLDILTRHFLPSVYGNWNVKKGILLMLAGGVEKTGEKDAMKLRGDININIVGDPGTAKSGILRAVNQFVPRSVYASGKMATAAGLTASVQRDKEQGGNPVIEAGALMLADGGICCIDEFDKMDTRDMSAIHEAMEQQTISIAKAGVQATLNARASVIAACNPIHGRYDPSKSFRQNVNLTAPILSRFDLMFVILDDTDLDETVAAHILDYDPEADNISGREDLFKMTELKLRKYLRVARTLRPKLTRNAMERLSSAYVVLRQQDVIPGAQRHTRMTVRQLESLVRLSEATAKLHLSDEVTSDHVQIAFDLFQSSLTRINKGTIDFLAPTEDGPPGECDPADGENRPTVRSVDATVYATCARAVVDHLLQMQTDILLNNDSSAAEELEDQLIDWLVEHQFPESDDEAVLMLHYETVGKIIQHMIEVDQTLVANTLVDDNNVETRYISLHPVVSAGTDDYLGVECLDQRALRARRMARSGHVPASETVETPIEPTSIVDDEEDLMMEEDRFGAYLEQMNNNL